MLRLQLSNTSERFFAINGKNRNESTNTVCGKKVDTADEWVLTTTLRGLVDVTFIYELLLVNNYFYHLII